MAEIYTGISVLKKINSLLKGKANSSLLRVGKKPQASAVNGVKLTPRLEKVSPSEIKSDYAVNISGENDKRIRELICQRLACEKAIRLKQEIKNFSSAWLSGLS